MRVAMIQVNVTVGDIAGNRDRLHDAIVRAAKEGAELAVCSELSMTGYPPRDLLDDAAFVAANRRAVEELAKAVPIPSIVGFVDSGAGFPALKNAAAVIGQGKVLSVHHKSLLPSYDVFDECRYFSPASDRQVTTILGQPVGVTICEDNWNDADFWPRRKYEVDPVEGLARAGAKLLITISASPFSYHKRVLRSRLWAAQAKKYGLPLIAVNQVGGNDDLIFDGGSLAFDKRGNIAARGREFDEDIAILDVDLATGEVTQVGEERRHHPYNDDGDVAAILDALVLGTKDYAHKCGFSRAVMGLSGGIDSAVTAAIAGRALGPENVWGIAMPSRFSSDHSMADAELLAKNLGLRFDVISIEQPFQSFLDVLSPVFAGTETGVAEENLQARARGVILMALSNKFGHLLLSTGNKSELAVGYCTLYGDMSGGLAVLSDVPKTLVYRLAHELNRRAGKAVVPARTIEKAPSAELKPNQTDQDSLPPYPVLDQILELLVEASSSRDDIVRKGFDPAVVDDIIRRFRLSEYKRYQAAPGLKVTDKAFGPGRRMPLAARYRLR